jgi:guanylate kinase
LRVENALRDISACADYYHLIVNDRLDQAVEMVKAVILAARSRSGRGRDGKALPHFPGSTREGS